MSISPTFPVSALRAVASTDPTEPELDLKSIKALLDGFDPAALLPDLEKIFGSLVPICRLAVLIGPVVMLALGLAYLLLSPKEANHYFGYRCYFGMGSVQAWRFTQRLAGALLGLVGLGLTVAMFLVCGSFSGMELPDMAWRAVYCLIVQAVLALLTNLIINITAAVLFDRRGDLRRRKKR